MKTLLLALLSPGKSRGTREGAIKGLIGVGKEAVRKGLVEAGGAKVVGSECMPGEDGGLGDAVVEAFKTLHPPSEYPVSIRENDDSIFVAHLREKLGDFFAERLLGDAEWARAIMGSG